MAKTQRHLLSNHQFIRKGQNNRSEAKQLIKSWSKRTLPYLTKPYQEKTVIWNWALYMPSALIKVMLFILWHSISLYWGGTIESHGPGVCLFVCLLVCLIVCWVFVCLLGVCLFVCLFVCFYTGILGQWIVQFRSFAGWPCVPWRGANVKARNVDCSAMLWADPYLHCVPFRDYLRNNNRTTFFCAF